jgi:hypothetical protein
MTMPLAIDAIEASGLTDCLNHSSSKARLSRAGSTRDFFHDFKNFHDRLTL